jgi:hypothetical protein
MLAREDFRLLPSRFYRSEAVIYGASETVRRNLVYCTVFCEFALQS